MRVIFAVINKKKMEFIHKHKLTLIGISIGLIGGYLYYAFVGCATGTCKITSSPINSTLYGGLMGGLLFSSFKSKKQTKWVQNKLSKNNEEQL